MNFNISKARLSTAFENLTGEALEDSQVFKLNKEATVDVIDYLDGQDNLDDMQKALMLQKKASDEIAIFVENTSELESIVKANEEKIIDKTATPQDVIVANETLAACCALFGIDKPVTVGFESLVNDPIEGLRVANEGIGESIKKGYDAVIAWFKKLFQGIWKFIKGIFGNTEKKADGIKDNNEAIKNNVAEIRKNKPIYYSKLKDSVNNNAHISNIKRYNPADVKKELSGNGNESLTFSFENMDDNLVVKISEVLASMRQIGLILFEEQYSLNDVLANISKLSTAPKMFESAISDINRMLLAMDAETEKVANEFKTMTTEEIIEKYKTLLPDYNKGDALVQSFLHQIEGMSNGMVKSSHTEVKNMVEILKELEEGMVVVIPNVKSTVRHNANNTEQAVIFFDVVACKIVKRDEKISIKSYNKTLGISTNFELNISEKDFKELVEKGPDIVDIFQDKIHTAISGINVNTSKEIENKVEELNKTIEKFINSLDKYLDDEALASKIDIGSFIKTNKDMVKFSTDAIGLFPTVVDVVYKASNNMLAYSEALLKLK